MPTNEYEYRFAADSDGADLWVSVEKYGPDSKHWMTRSGIKIPADQIPAFIDFLKGI